MMHLHIVNMIIFDWENICENIGKMFDEGVIFPNLLHCYSYFLNKNIIGFIFLWRKFLRRMQCHEKLLKYPHTKISTFTVLSCNVISMDI